ncbi:Scytalone dehydratase [Aspergillus homomorphus CBS 101889]|uniref:Scytalone dehydratase n=1 Tax=Aspergillus homomorphus (strain CBS 101889) TaxID=1450537 RepID=A0A395IDG9_ASPHC|nr:Scytalone dehydratase [Aspergillus homomorphus CBS 101889]RAL16204.1 Scytalone dehydratase [Aspergillus homomorphus CBS 101889]
MSKNPTFEDITSCQRALFEWADSYDTKDWERLRKSVAPTLRIDYRSFLDKIWEAMPRDEFILMASDPRFLGNPLLKTQHLVGLSTWEKVAEDRIVGHHQLRVAHQRYTDDTFKEVAVKGHAHGTATMWYTRVEGEWMFAGVCPQINWTEFNYDQVFAEGKEHFGQNGENGGNGH